MGRLAQEGPAGTLSTSPGGPGEEMRATEVARTVRRASGYKWLTPRGFAYTIGMVAEDGFPKSLLQFVTLHRRRVRDGEGRTG